MNISVPIQQRGAKAAVYLLLVCVLPCHGQTPKEQPKTPPEFTAQGLLIRSYVLGSQFVAPERAFHLVRLTEAATAIEPSYAKLWGEELFALTFRLPASHNRVAIQKNALVALSRVDPERALQLFESMDLPYWEPDGSIPEDVRAFGATTIFGEEWKRKGQSSLGILRSHARRLAETGQYPYMAMLPILGELARENEPESHDIFLEALSAYSRGSRSRSSNREFVRLLLGVRELLPKSLLQEGVRAAVARLSSLPDSGRQEEYRSRVYTDRGAASFRSEAKELLYALLPLIREVNAPLAHELLEKTPELQQVGTDADAPPKRSEAIVIQGRSEPGQVEDLQRLGMEEQRLDHIGSIASREPEEAYRLSVTLTEPVLRAVALCRTAAGLYPTAPMRARALISEARQLLDSSKSGGGRVKVWVAIAEASEAMGDIAMFREALRTGFDLGTEIFQQDLDANPSRPAIFADSFEELSRLTLMGIKNDKESTLRNLMALDNPVLQAHLLVDAAMALGNSQTKPLRREDE